MADRFVPLTPRVGAKVVVPRDEVLDPTFADECLAGLERYGVLVFRGIDLDDDELVAFSENLGELMPFGGDRVYKITLDPRENPVGADYLKNTTGWHIDGLFEDAPPPRASILAARRLSASGGQTEFCNTYAAYDDLPEADRKRCEPLRVLHTLEASNRAMSPDDGPEDVEAWRKAQARREKMGRRGEKEHPLVWRHRSGRRSLVLGMTVDHVVGLPDAGSRELVERLSAHTTRRENVYRHEWQMGDVIIWDNCGVMHRVIPYDRDSGRLMHRTTLCGDERIEGIEAAARHAP
jgi:alpha-ketoglutarate-dependent taurine dioxygenase